MAMKLIAIYSTPDDPAAFDAHYANVHTPLAQQIPGLQELRVSYMRKKLMGSQDVYLIAEMVFADKAAFDVGMGSAENQAAGKDLANFAKGKVSLMIAED